MTLLRYLFFTLTGQEARRLNLYIFQPRGEWELSYIGMRWHMAQINDTVVCTIAPTNAAGKPAKVTDVVFQELSDLYDEVAVSEDGYSVTFKAVKSGTGATVAVSALSKAGVTLTAAAALPDVAEPPEDEEAVALNLTVA